MKILLCDEERKVLEECKKRLIQIGDKKGLDIEIIEFSNGEYLIINIEEWINDISIIYIKIEGRIVDGITLAKNIRNLGYDREIVFVARSKQYAFKAFDVYPTGYMLQEEIYKDKFEVVFMQCLSNLDRYHEENFIFKSGKFSVIVPLKDIYYFEVNNKVITINYNGGNVDFYSNLNNIEKILKDKNFLRIHRSYLINLDNISKFSKEIILLKSGSKLSIGRTYINSVIDVLNSRFNPI